MKAIPKSFRVGDAVSWNTPQGQTSGVVKKKLTAPTHVKTHKVSATKQNPEYLVESAKSGQRAAHKGAALKKVGTQKND